MKLAWLAPATLAAIAALAMLPFPGYPWTLAAPVVGYWAACGVTGWRTRRRVLRPRPQAPGCHAHGPTDGPCVECLITTYTLLGLVGAMIEDAERLADTGDIREAHHLAQVSRWLADMDADATADMAARTARVNAMRFELSAPLAGVLPCAAQMGAHLCRARIDGPHLHQCSCGESWGLIP